MEMLLILTLTLTSFSLVAESSSSLDPNESSSNRLKAPRGNWVGDYEIDLGFFKWKSIYCDKANDEIYVKKPRKS
jgi:hypothetical protein